MGAIAILREFAAATAKTFLHRTTTTLAVTLKIH
jgi:hypothetical protein